MPGKFAKETKPLNFHLLQFQPKSTSQALDNLMLTAHEFSGGEEKTHGTQL